MSGWPRACARPSPRSTARSPAFDAIELSVPVARHMVDLLKGGKPDFAVWGVVVP